MIRFRVVAGFLPATTLDKTTILLSCRLWPWGHHGFQCSLLLALYLSITTYYRHSSSSDNHGLPLPWQSRCALV